MKAHTERVILQPTCVSASIRKIYAIYDVHEIVELLGKDPFAMIASL